MPTKEQIFRVTDEIDNFVGGLEVVRLEGERIVPASASREGEYLFWDDLVATQRRDALAIVVDWQGFTEGQKDSVIQRVLDGESRDSWMDGIDVITNHDHCKERFMKILAEQKIDYQAADLRDSGQDYEKFLKEATERAQARLQGKEGREI